MSIRQEMENVRDAIENGDTAQLEQLKRHDIPAVSHHALSEKLKIAVPAITGLTAVALGLWWKHEHNKPHKDSEAKSKEDVGEIYANPLSVDAKSTRLVGESFIKAEEIMRKQGAAQNDKLGVGEQFIVNLLNSHNNSTLGHIKIFWKTTNKLHPLARKLAEMRERPEVTSAIDTMDPECRGIVREFLGPQVTRR